MFSVVQWWDVLFVKGMHFSSKDARLLNVFSKRLTSSRSRDTLEWLPVRTRPPSESFTIPPDICSDQQDLWEESS